MTQKWIKRKGEPACILFFNGWGMDEHVLDEFDHRGFDVCHLNDFSQIEPLPTDEFQYQTIIVVAWSLGVCAANEILPKSKLQLTQCLAINGTPWVRHDEMAIPHTTFKQTLDGWNERTRFKFNLRMFGGKNRLDKATKQQSQRSTANQKLELQFFYDLEQTTANQNLSWDAAFVAINDQIIPTAHQLNFWSDKARVIETDWTHFPFSEVKSWHELLKIAKQ
ncbi:pimeloyl-ACP methyl esterase BioG family protein [Mangrovibacterium lignilyticum]|uniref:pimeloyl-ACP methyl esterase BioG family protein n=1 Tax=Mangrovibacterium lignilyticum TaxID=2668052 RepID=UPI0013D82FBB|nr:pimeloyl-ACP methyl esterase BioG family protein [Mangrovibacterium lignilyticum]